MVKLYDDKFIEFKKSDTEIKYDIKGKWLIFFSDFAYADKLCKDLVDNDIVLEANHSIGGTSGVCRIFVDAKNLEQHRKVLRYLIDNQHIPRTKKGNHLYNIAFKLQLQTDRLEYYGWDFENLLSLCDLVDLKTGKFLDVNNSVFDRIDKYLKPKKSKKRKK